MASSWRVASTRLASTRRALPAWMSAAPRAALPTVCSSAAPPASSRSTLATRSSTGRSGTTRASSFWSEPTSSTSPRPSAWAPSTWPSATSRLPRCSPSSMPCVPCYVTRGRFSPWSSLSSRPTARRWGRAASCVTPRCGWTASSVLPAHLARLASPRRLPAQAPSPATRATTSSFFWAPLRPSPVPSTSRPSVAPSRRWVCGRPLRLCAQAARLCPTHWWAAPLVPSWAGGATLQRLPVSRPFASWPKAVRTGATT